MADERTTLAHIAELAGVSVPTVSKALNGHRDVSARTREQIERIVVEQGYVRPVKTKPKPRRSTAALLDLVINELDSSWATEILTGTEEVAREHGMHLVLTAVHADPTPGKGWLESLAARGSRGVILVLSDLSTRQRTELDRLSIPYVLVDAVGRPDPAVPSVGATNWHGGYAAVQHLLSLGHKRISVIGGPEQLLCTKARVAGYRNALEVAGLPYDPRLVRYGDFRHEQGYLQTKALLELSTPPTAVFAGSDLQALGAYQALHEHRLRVPDDVSVVGFDDLPFAPWTAPPLTTVRQPLREMGALATRMLLSLIRGEKLAAPRAELATNLIVRGSTAPVRR
ncbi:LacI family DNA-binding transcriptional regulator [Umezawaea sp. NPDC059074]|uniref:LacI family DNA-binding transcriptional regulator n=1 Tax=Umezawaea sp. NPDC059074 TaxID=3346716 RepID=UPI00368D960D